MSTIYSVTLTQQQTGHPPNMGVYFYRVDDIADAFAEAEICAEAFAEDVLPEINAVQSNSMNNSSLEVFNLYDPTDIFSLGLTGAGTIAEAIEQGAQSIGFRSQRSRRDVRRGGKRIGGVPLSYVTNSNIQAGAIAAIEALALQLADTIVWSEDENSVPYRPCVVKRIFTGIVNGKRQYRLPETVEETTVVGWVNTEYSLTARTQTSRTLAPAWTAP